MKKRGAHASTWKMELMHGTEKQGLLHHFLDARAAGDALSSEDVVLDDERTRACGRRSTTSGTPASRAEGPSKRTDAQSVPLIFLIYPTCLIYPVFQSIRLAQVSGLPRHSPTSPSGFSWSSSWIAASSGFWHVPARSGRSAAGPWNRTGSNNSCC